VTFEREEGPLRVDGDVIVSGHAEYLDDIAPPGLLHAALLRSPHPHARILAVRTAAAEALPGVRVVLTGEQVAKLSGPVPHYFDPAAFGLNSNAPAALATDKVRWVGDPVAAVVAETLADAEAAVRAIDVDYELLPSVFDAEEALEPDAPKLFEDWPENAIGRFPNAQGDAAGRIAAAPRRLEGRIDVARHQSTPMETRGYVGWWRPGDRITFWGSTQSPHLLRTNVSTALGVAEERIQVIAPRMGGGFGHKFNGYAEEVLVCVLSRLTGAPVKWLETRAESLLVGAREFAHDFEVGYDDDGIMLGLRNRMVGNVGSLATWGGWGMVFMGGMTFPGPYRCVDYEIESIAAVTNKPPWTGYRGYGKEQAAIVLERIMDMVAEDLDLDPAEVRRRNFVDADAFPLWLQTKHIDSGDYHGALDKVLAMANYDGLREEQRYLRAEGRHIGIGIGFELTPEGGEILGTLIRGHDSSTVRVHPLGGVTVLTGVTSPGTGNETSIAFLVARELGIAIGNVDVVMGDTDRCPYGFGNFSSRSLVSGGAAAVLAARDIREQMASAAAHQLECDARDLVFADDRIAMVGDEAKSVPFAEVAALIFKTAGSEPGSGNALLEATRLAGPHNFHHVPDEQGRTNAYPMFSFTVQVVVVDVDVETGVVGVRRVFAVADCGTVVNMNFVNGQVRGAIAQGLGGALWEQSPFDPRTGRAEASTFKQYLLPRASDLPYFEVMHQETPSPFTLLGMKGAGESGVGSAMAAVTNAVNDAMAPLGARVHRLPLNPPNVLTAILGEDAR
jgi:carbon-monoxide dehydrogenase large subunit